MLGIDSPSADAEVIATAIQALANLGLTNKDITVRISHRDVVAKILLDGGLPENQMQAALGLLDKRQNLAEEAFIEKVHEAGIEPTLFSHFDKEVNATHEDLTTLQDELVAWGVEAWCTFDFSIVRGLAYYTGIVFEIHEAGGNERAIAGGGRYDGLVEMFGGPPIPAVGFGMGDVVLSLVLRDKGLLGDGNEFLPTPDVFVISAGDEGDAAMTKTISLLRQANLHARRSYKATKNVGKLLTEAAKTGANFVVILGEELSRGEYVVKNLNTKDQVTVTQDNLVDYLTS
jgi:histidyl-tRNA synthetase